MALFVVIALSCFTKVNPGLLSLGLAWLLGYYGAHMGINQIAAGFPVYIFIVLVGVTYLFGIAKHNGTLEKLAQNSPSLGKEQLFTFPSTLFYHCCRIIYRRSWKHRCGCTFSTYSHGCCLGNWHRRFLYDHCFNLWCQRRHFFTFCLNRDHRQWTYNQTGNDDGPLDPNLSSQFLYSDIAGWFMLHRLLLAIKKQQTASACC